ncbi:hypothetical protein NDU88_010800 [Pleurodeles waltl]|uniref:Uncharacterized protein n=1 Tax=Pleurodeles waltl TaxID=8319 RepID=A0AAV7PYZ3_PLEWA|nr:hypothetical protein NDU88_010800 [Pleurodeles waltl]
MEHTVTEDSKEGGDNITHVPTIQEMNGNAKHPVQSTVSSDSSRAQEKKRSASSTKPPSSSSAHQKGTHTVDKVSHSSAVINPVVDLQSSVFGRSGSSLSSMTVPIRLDALSYLLNNALMGAYRMAPPMPMYGNQCAMPVCQSAGPLYPSPMGQVTPTNCAGHGCCSAHFTAPVCPTAQLVTHQPQVYPGNMCPESSRLLTRPTGTQNEATILYPPAVQQDTNAISMNTSVGWCTTKNGSANVIESNKWNNKPVEANLEKQNPNFVQPKSSFTGDPDGQNTSPKRTISNSSQGSFGSWKDNQRGNNWSGRQQRDFDRPMGRSNDNFSSSSWRGNSRDQGRDSGFGGKPWNSDFGNRKRNQDEGSWSQDEGQGGFKQGRWSSGRGRGGGSGSWQQRSDDSITRYEFGSSSGRFKSSATSSFASSFSKNDNSSDDWESSYKQEKTVDKRPSYSNSRAPSTPIDAHSSSFGKKDDSNDDWEADYKSAHSNKTILKVPSELDQKPPNLTPQLANRNREDVDIVFHTAADATVAEAPKAMEISDKGELVKKGATLKDKSNTPEPNTQNDEEKGIFEKFMPSSHSDTAPINDSTGQSAVDEMEEGELNDTLANVNTEQIHMKPINETPLCSRICTSPLPSEKEACCREVVISEDVKTQMDSINTPTVSEAVDSQKELLHISAVSVALPTHSFPTPSAVSESYYSKKELSPDSAVETGDTEVELSMQSTASEIVNATVDIADTCAFDEVVTKPEAMTEKSVGLDSVNAAKDNPSKLELEEAVNPPENTTNECDITDTNNIQHDVTNKFEVSEVVVTQQDTTNEPEVSEALIPQQDITNEHDVSEAVNTEQDITTEHEVSEAVSTLQDKTIEPEASGRNVDRKNIMQNLVVSEEVMTENGIARKSVDSDTVNANGLTKISAVYEAVVVDTELTNKCTGTDVINKSKEIPSTSTFLEVVDSDDILRSKETQIKDEEVVTLVFSSASDSTKHVVMEIRDTTDG